VIGTGGIVAALALIVGGVVIGSLLGGPGGDTRSVLGLGTGQRNISAALLVSSQSFNDPNVLAMVLVGSTVGLFILLPLAFEIGRRAARAPRTVEEAKRAQAGSNATTESDVPPPRTAPAAG
jgi:H+/gluconate symporter-like permease